VPEEVMLKQPQFPMGPAKDLITMAIMKIMTRKEREIADSRTKKPRMTKIPKNNSTHGRRKAK
jgi:hypothetical protein